MTTLWLPCLQINRLSVTVLKKARDTYMHNFKREKKMAQELILESVNAWKNYKKRTPGQMQDLGSSLQVCTVQGCRPIFSSTVSLTSEISCRAGQKDFVMHLEGCGKPLDLFVQRKRVYQQIWFLASELWRYLHPGGTYSFFSFMLNVAGNMIDDQVSALKNARPLF